MESIAYPFKTKPFQHQLTCWNTSRDAEAFAFYMEMGTGKSKCLIDTAAYLYDADRIDALVVVAPKGVYRNWGDSELPTHMPAHIRYRVAVWSASPTKAETEALEALRRKTGDVDLLVLLVNVEALGRDLKNNRAFDFLQDFLLGHKAMLAVDESTVIKNPQATRTKALLKLRRYAPYRRILSGQPVTKGPLDLYSQCEFLDPHLLGFGSYFSYRAHFCNLVKMQLNKPGNNRPILTLNKKTPYKNLDELQRIISKFSFIVKKEDCLDLPPKVYTVRHIELGKQQQKAYDAMRKLAMVEIEDVLQKDGAGTGEGPLSTANIVITKMLRLHQILCGFLVADDRKTVVPFDEPNPRLEDMMDALEEVSGKAIIWCTYKFNVRQICARIAEKFGPESVVHFFGETSQEDRRAVAQHFDMSHPLYDPNGPVRFVVANRTGARGNTWTAGKDVFYFSNDYDLDTRCQNEDRSHRIGQTQSCTYTDYIVPGTQDEVIVNALRGKLDISKAITVSNWKEFIR